MNSILIKGAITLLRLTIVTDLFEVNNFTRSLGFILTFQGIAAIAGSFLLNLLENQPLAFILIGIIIIFTGLLRWFIPYKHFIEQKRTENTRQV